MKNLLQLLAVFFLCCPVANAQFVFTDEKLPQEISFLDKASIVDIGHSDYALDLIRSDIFHSQFKPMTGRLGNLGFTDHTYWVKFEMKNALKIPVNYYIETAEPVTDNVNLYWIDAQNNIELQRSGDNLAFSERSVPNRRTVFTVALKPGQTKQAYMQIRNDGEKNNLPLKLIRPSQLLEKTYGDQLMMGLFYGILLVIAITYLFFYFAINENSFLHYSLYVVFMGLCQFALDGFYHQYIGTGNSWLSLHMVILSAILSCFFFGKYSVTVLNIKQQNPIINQIYNGLFVLLALLLAAVLVVPNFLQFSYPIINILTLAGIVLIFGTVATMLVRKQEIDKFYVGGILILFVCIVLAVLMNFGIFPENFSTDNITKPGIALEVIALSLSMANRIRLLKSKKEELQEVALQKSEEMNDIKSYFLSNMSHELRTPLNAILNLASAMENENKDPKIRENCEIIRYASHGLISSVNDILDFSRIEKGELQLENRAFKPQEVFEKLYGTVRKQIEDKGLDFVFSSDFHNAVSVNGDPIRLEQIIYNLLGNAAKFTASGAVRFEIKTTIANGRAALKIVVADTGMGIPKAKLDSVFGLFSQTQLDNKRKFGGFGIGLSIVKSLVDLHGGTIMLESEVDRGTTCTLTFEYEVAEDLRQTVQTTQKAIDYTGKNVLIVEDNAMNQMVIKMMLKGLPNLAFAVANDGAECLEMMREKHYDLILMDLQMPVMDGYEAISAIRGGKAGTDLIDVPIVVVTADVISETKDRVFALGANDYLTKPVDKKLLFEKIERTFFRPVLKAV